MRVFFSYSHGDRLVQEHVATFARALDGHFTVLWDQKRTDEGIRPGDVWDETLKHHIQSAGAAVIFISAGINRQDGYAYRFEIPALLERRAVDRTFHVITVLADTPPGFEEHWEKEFSIGIGALPTFRLSTLQYPKLGTERLSLVQLAGRDGDLTTIRNEVATQLHTHFASVATTNADRCGRLPTRRWSQVVAGKRLWRVALGGHGARLQALHSVSEPLIAGDSTGALVVSSDGRTAATARDGVVQISWVDLDAGSLLPWPFDTRVPTGGTLLAMAPLGFDGVRIVVSCASGTFLIHARFDGRCERSTLIPEPSICAAALASEIVTVDPDGIVRPREMAATFSLARVDSLDAATFDGDLVVAAIGTTLAGSGRCLSISVGSGPPRHIPVAGADTDVIVPRGTRWPGYVLTSAGTAVTQRSIHDYVA